MSRASRRSIRKRRRFAARIERLERRDLLAVDVTQNQAQPEPAWFTESTDAIISAFAPQPLAKTADFTGPMQSLRLDWVVQLTPTATANVQSLLSVERLLSKDDIEFRAVRGLGTPGLVQLQSLTADQAKVETRLSTSPYVKAFSLNHSVTASAVPNDSDFGNQFALDNTGQFGWQPDADIDAQEAWNETTGSWQVVVGVIDSGLDLVHPDLYRNVWINQGEIQSELRASLTDVDADKLITFFDLNAPENARSVRDLNTNGFIDAEDLLNDPDWTDGIDTDRNGFIDDFFGWNFRAGSDDALAPNNPSDISGHGSHVAGIIGASGNNSIGVAGINWRTSLMSLRFLDQNNQGDIASAVAAFNYASMMKQDFQTNVRVLNASWGQAGSPVPELQSAIETAAAADILVVAAAGNGNVLGIGIDNDRSAFYPASYPVDNILAVAASDGNDQLAAFSNYGATSVDLVAPGIGIRSTLPGGRYGEANGTSMAAPMVSGAAALVWSALPQASLAEVRAALLNSVDVKPNLVGRTVTGGRLNAAATLASPSFAPTAVLVRADNVTQASATQQEVVVRYADRNGIDLASLGSNDIEVEHRWGTLEKLNVQLQSDSIQASADRTVVTATYLVTAPGGDWDVLDFGQYAISTRVGSVSSSGTALSIRAQALGDFRVQIAAPDVMYVSRFDDPFNPTDGLSLRQAISISNAQPTRAQTIILDTGRYELDIPYVADQSFAFASPAASCSMDSEVPLWSNSDTGDLDVLGELTIVGNSPQATTLDAQLVDRALKVHPTGKLTLQRLSITGGQAPAGQGGGAILSAGHLTLVQVNIDGNTADSGSGQPGRGGSIAAWSGSVQISQSQLTGNSAEIGGAVFACGQAVLTVAGSTIDNNRGGGIASYSASNSSVDSSTLANNFGEPITSRARDLPGVTGSSFAPVISRDGSQLAFLSSSVDLVAGDTNQAVDAFVYTLNTGVVQRVSLSNTGQQASRETDAIAVGNNAQEVAFISTAGNLVAGDNSFTSDVFLRDIQGAATVRISTTGGTTRAVRGQIAMSADGRYVAYQQAVSDNIGGNTWGVFIADKTSQSVRRVSMTLADGSGIASINALDQLAMSADGRYLAISAGQSGEFNQQFYNIYLYDSQTDSLSTLPARRGQADGALFSASLSDDGRFIAFASDDSSLVSGDTNGTSDVFVYDQQSRLTQRISQSQAGIQGNLASLRPGINGDGRYVAFSSSANNLVIGDNNNRWDVFLADRVTGQVQRLSQTSDSTEANGDSTAPSISSDGRWIAFESTANNLTSTNINHRLSVQGGRRQVFLADRVTGQLQSVSSFGLPSTLTVTNSTLAFNTSSTTVSGHVSISSSLLAGNLADFDFGAQTYSLGYNIYASGSSDASVTVRDLRNSDSAIRLSELTSLDGRPPGYQLLEGNPAIDAGAPQSVATRDQWQQLRLTPDVGALEAVSGSLSGYVFVDLNNNSIQDSNEAGLAHQTVYLDVNGDGIHQDAEPIVQTTDASDVRGPGFYRFDHLAPGDNSTRLVVPDNWQITSPSIVRVTQGNIQGNGPSSQAVFGATGRSIAFLSTANNFVSGDTSAPNIFIYDRASGSIEKIPIEGANLRLLQLLGDHDQWVLLRNDTGVYLYDRDTRITEAISVSNNGQLANAHSDWASASSDGRWIAYSSFGSNLVSGDNDNHADIFLFDRQNRTVVSVTRLAAGTQGNNDSEWPAISDDGSTIAFVSDATNLVGGDTNARSDIFVYRTATQTLQRITLSANGEQSNGFTYPPQLSGNGRYVLFQSLATNLLPNPTNGAGHLFVYDLQNSVLERLDIPFKSGGSVLNYGASISADGQYVTFEASKSNLNWEGAKTERNIFVYDRFWSADSGTARMMLVSQPPQTIGSTTPENNGNSLQNAISHDGRWFAFQSLASNLVSNDTNGQADILVMSNPFELNRQDVSLEVGQQITGSDFALFPLPGILAGVLFNDLSGDSVFDFGDPGLAGWIVYLDSNFNGRRDVGERSTISASDGSYQLESVPTQRDLGLAVEVPSNWEQVAPANRPTRLFLPAGGQSLQRHFAFRQKGTTGQSNEGKIEGRIFNDLNRDGIQQVGEAGQERIEVYLDSDNDGQRDSDEQRETTDSQGNYTFSRLAGGNYVVRTVTGEGSILTSPLGNRFTITTTPNSNLSTTIYNPQEVLLVDIDGTKGPDIATIYANGNALTISLNNGQSQYGNPILISLGNESGPVALVSGQLNARGGPDLVVANSANGTVTVLFDFQGTGFGSQTSFPVLKGVALRDVALADLDGDGDLDLLALTGDSSNPGAIHTFFNDGQGQFTKAASAFAVPSVNSVALITGDFNRDGRIDAAVASYGSGANGSIAVLLGQTGNRFATATLYNVGALPVDLDSGDLNGDSWPDLVTVNFGLNTATILQGSSTGTFTVLPNRIAVPEGPLQVKLADMEGDGDRDVLVSNVKGNQLSIIRNRNSLVGNGQMSLEPAESFGVGALPISPRPTFALGDVDGNGTLDIALTNSASSTIKVLSNQIVAGANRAAITGTNTVTSQNFGMVNQILLPKLESLSAPSELREDSGVQSLVLSGLAKGRSSTQQLRVTVSSSQPAIIPLQQQVLTNSTSLSIAFSSAADANGTTAIGVEVRDPGADQLFDSADDGVITRSHTIAITPVNDAPTFALAGNQVVTIGSDLRVKDGFASNFFPGGGNDERDQTIAEYLVSTDDTSLFLVQPAIDNLGTLRFQPRTKTGLATVTVQVRDSGGTESGGQDRSQRQSFQISITDLSDGNIDFGDAPASYRVSITDDGARHEIDGLYLGSSVDAEPNGQASSDALADDRNLDDEDGIEFLTQPLTMDNVPTLASLVATITSASGQPARLDGWIDFNRNGNWGDSGEQILTSAVVQPGRNLLSYTIPAGSLAGGTFARFRLSAQAGLRPNGLVQGGEVEDYAINVLSGASVPQTIDVRADLAGTHDWVLSDGQLLMLIDNRPAFTAPASRVAQVRGLISSPTELYAITQPAVNLVGRLHVDSDARDVRLHSSAGTLNLSALSASAFRGVQYVMLDGTAPQTIDFVAADLSKLSTTASVIFGLGNDDSLRSSSTWSLNNRLLRNGELLHEFGSGSSVLFISSAADWRNAFNQYDVSTDGTITPLDALLIINYLNRTVGSNNIPAFDPAHPLEQLFVDVNGDNLVTAIDALLVINRLN